MTTLYRPVLIESAEQAEALPEGTVAFQSWGHGTTARTLTGGRWITPSGAALPHAEVVGMQALVPIEAEEEHGARGDGEAEDFYLTRRFVTPWEEA